MIRMLENVQHVTIKPLIQATILPDDISSRLEQWGYEQESVCHSRGEYTRDDDGDGFHAVHVNTMEGFWGFDHCVGHVWARRPRMMSTSSHAPFLRGIGAFASPRETHGVADAMIEAHARDASTPLIHYPKNHCPRALHGAA